MQTLNLDVRHIRALPTLPDTLVQLQKVVNNPFSSFQELSNAIQKDPLLVANILKFANSPVYGLKEPVTTLTQAISLFGMSAIIGFAMTKAIHGALKVDFTPYRVNTAQFLETATAQNALAFRWRKGLNPEQNNIFMTASFLMEIGSLLIADYLIREHLSESFQNELETDKALIDIEIEFCGFNHLEIGASMFEEWGFDPAVIAAMREGASDQAHDEIAKRLHVIGTAINLKERLSGASIQASLQSAEKLGFDTQELGTILANMCE